MKYLFLSTLLLLGYTYDQAFNQVDYYSAFETITQEEMDYQKELYETRMRQYDMEMHNSLQRMTE